MIREDTIEKLRKRYKNIHPLLFKRSVERANNEVELFDILESMPKSFPIVWDNEKRQWINSNLFES